MLKDAEGFVFAGGRSSRMGRDKAFIPVGGRPLVARVAETLHRMTRKVTVIGRPDKLEQLRDVLPEHVTVIPDFIPDRGPLMGVYTALLHAARPVVVCVPCDMPEVTYALIRKLFDHLDDSILACASGIPGDGWQPFPLVCRTAAASTVGALLDQNKSAMRDLLQGSGGRIVTVTEPGLLECFRNLNTPADLAGKETHGLIAY